MPTLHHHAATRLTVGTLPLLSCAVSLVLHDLLLSRDLPRDGLAAARAAALVSCLIAEAVCVTLVRRGGVAATARVAKLAAALYVLPAAAVAHAAFAGGAGPVTIAAKVAAVERAWAAFVALGAPFFALSGLPPRFACILEAARASLFLLVIALHLITSSRDVAELAAAAAATRRLGVKVTLLTAATPVALRATLGADEARELTHLHGLCPWWARPACDALLTVGAAAQRVPGAEAAAAAALLTSLPQFCTNFARALVLPDPSAASPLRRCALSVAWVTAFTMAVAGCVALAVRRAARHAVSPAAARALQVLHVHLSALDAAAPPDVALSAVAVALLAALPPGCAVALAEWTVVDLAPAPPSPLSSPVASSRVAATPRSSACSDDAEAQSAQRHIEMLRVAARGTRYGAAAAMRAAARRGSAPLGSAAAALAKPAAAAGLTLDSSDFLEGVGAFADWAALCADARCGPGTVSLALLGSGDTVCGGMWVHAPAAAPAPAALRAYAEAVGAVLLRNATQAEALRAAAAAARADADATLALQRTFLSGVTHELRTPLNAVVGFTATVLEGAALAPRDAEYLRCSLSSANSLLGIIDQLLEYAKWGQMEDNAASLASAALAHVPLRLPAVLDELVDVLGGRAAAAGVRLLMEARSCAAAAALRGDVPRLRQVLVNLVDNAMKNTPSGGMVVLTADVCAAPRCDMDDGDSDSSAGESGGRSSARSSIDESGGGSGSKATTDLNEDAFAAAMLPPPACRSSLESDNAAPLPIWLRITVADTGIGIPPEQRWRLFRPFSQVPPAHGSGGAKPPGTGLGLVISRAFVRSLGGDITFTSTPGVGTTFSVFAPFAADFEAEPGPANEATALEGVALLPLLRDAALAGMLTRTAAQWGAAPVATSALPLLAYNAEASAGPTESQTAEAVHLRGFVSAAAGVGASRRALLVLADPRAAMALCGEGAPPLAPRTVCLLAAPSAEQAGLAGLGAAPLDLPTSPRRLLAALRAATAAAEDYDGTAAVKQAPLLMPLEAPPSPPPSALRVLLAEDNPMNAAVARAVLARCGVAAPRVVADGAEAVAAFQESQWHVLLLDMRMPHMSGPEAARAIREIEAKAPATTRRTHIVAVTANSSKEDRHECLVAGMDEFLVKPITPAILRALLGRIAAAL